MSADHTLFPHDLPTLVAPGLWRVVGSLAFPLKRNMFVLKLPDGGLLLHSVVAMNDAGLAALEALGRPAIMVVPHPMHVMDAPFYKARYPHLRVVGRADAGARVKGVTFDGTPEQVLPALGIGVHLAAGMKIDEIVLDVPIGDGRGLLFTDLVGQNEGATSFLLKLLGPPGGAGVARIVRFRQIADKGAVRDFLRSRAETPGLRLVAGCHGGVVTHDCAGWLRRAADGL
jgi:hypothetical protein